MYLFGASGHAKVIIDSLKASGVVISGLFDDNPEVKTLLNNTVFGSFDSQRLGNDELIISVGVNNIRKKITEKLPQDINYGRAIHPSAIISEYASIDKGTVVMQGAIIQSSVKIGEHCIINTTASVDHDCIIEDFVHISPNATLCGAVLVGEGSQVGAGAVIIPGIKIGKWSLVAAGAVVMKDVPDNVLVLGNPARVVKRINL
ncbi:acetyltransferase [uncultured Proteiniphilum sp.]|uniref:acetyltransferase n=1 Tax=uncultured Proteiniphilum sp. TaxID=497637 RepID=UPI0026118322|nr:acetyltransferase [uncultured Proteiniphilum sp.]